MASDEGRFKGVKPKAVVRRLAVLTADTAVPSAEGTGVRANA
ncbi:hypothetical protein [Streptomyces syringium]